MANKKDVFLIKLLRIAVPVLYLREPVKINFFPVRTFACSWIAGTATGDVGIVRKIRYLVELSYIKFIEGNFDRMELAPFVDDLANTTHALVRLSFIEI